MKSMVIDYTNGVTKQNMVHYISLKDTKGYTYVTSVCRSEEVTNSLISLQTLCKYYEEIL